MKSGSSIMKGTKLNTVNSSSTDKDHKMAVTRLQRKIARFESTHIYCVELIFNLLNWAQLINLAESSKKMAEQIQEYYSRKYAKARVNISLARTEDWEKSAIENHGRQIFIHGKKYAFKFIRLLGPMLNQISIWYGEDKKFNDNINAYIHKYMRKNLEIMYCRNGTLLTKNRMFENMKAICFHNETLKNKQHNLAKLMPNLKKLSISKMQRNIIQKMKNVKEIKIITSHKRKENNMIKQFIARNSQLEKIELMWHNGLRTTSSLIQNALTLKELTLDGLVGTEAKDNHIIKLIKNHPFLTNLNLCTHILSFNQIMLIYHELRFMRVFRCEIEGTMLYLNENINYNIKHDFDKYTLTITK